MRRAFLLLIALVLALPDLARAQETWPIVRPPRALVAQLLRDLDRGDELRWSGVDSLAKWITVQRHDFNGDGVGEWVVEGTRYCGTNCSRWIYRRLPRGRFRQVHAGGGVSLDLLPRRSHGWHHVRDYWHLSCCEGSSIISVFGGQRYRWRETRHIKTPIEGPGGERTVYLVSIMPPNASGRRRLTLAPVSAGGGVWLSARHDVCDAAEECGRPELRISSARLPAGRSCVTIVGTFQVDMPGPHRDSTIRLCGQTARQTIAGRPTRTLVLHPSRADWGKLWYANDVRIRGAGVNATLSMDVESAVSVFSTRLSAYYRLYCPRPYECKARR